MTKRKLHNIESGFKTPDNYFNQFEDNLLREIKLKERVSNSGHKVPTGYFENFEVTIDKQNPTETKVISLFSRKTLLYAASIAAIAILIINIPAFKTTQNFASLDVESMETYMLDNDYSAYDLSDLITDSEAFEESILDEALINISLEDYFYENIELEDFNIE